MLKQVVPIDRRRIEIGIGIENGIFAEKLNIAFGINTSKKILEYAKLRN
ncbi:MAG: hypothetical protein KKF62_18700 [Bacteroidetes bacterium]|nr:hypothetical protein [Bacteroidota bacterium]MBU1116905.1 hypothetical protein [Bacteroidota bacterium]MBU1797417.1 hypothetical protein [Bacteroidota bacterium]